MNNRKQILYSVLFFILGSAGCTLNLSAATDFGVVTARMKELAGSYGLAVSIEFEAKETTDQQMIEYADFAFSKPPRVAAKPAAASTAPQPQQKEAERAVAHPQSAPVSATR